MSDFLSRHPDNDTSSPNEIIAFVMQDFSEYVKEISPISDACIMQAWSDNGDERNQVYSLRDIECDEIEPRDEQIVQDIEGTEIESRGTLEVCKVTEIELQNTLEECNITTRGMRQNTGEKAPDIWPLKGKHRKLENVPNRPRATTPEISEIIPEILPEELPRFPNSNPIPVLTNPNPPITIKPLRQELPIPPDPVPFKLPEQSVQNEHFVMPPRQMPTGPELPNISDLNFRPNINLQP